VKFLRKLFGLDGPKPTAARGRDRDFDLRGLERILHYTFKDPALARLAVTHRSYLHAAPGRGGESNERMEFLGDSVVGLIVNEYLYKKFTKLREGEMTKMKSLLVSRVILSRAANQLGLGNYILLSEAEKGSGGRNRQSILADTIEGVIGAVYLDGGLEPASKLTERLILREVHTILSDANLANYKSMLQEYVQGEFKTHPQYRISSEYGPDHQKMFTVEVVVSGKTFGRGHGSNKKEAEQEAARDALFHFEKLVRPEKERGGGDAAGQAGESRRRRRRGGRGRRNGGRGRGEGSGPPEGPGSGSGRRRRSRENREPNVEQEIRGHAEGPSEHGSGGPGEGSGASYAAARLHAEP
jgi:ribonuclease-3